MFRGVCHLSGRDCGVMRIPHQVCRLRREAHDTDSLSRPKSGTLLQRLPFTDS